ncbi:uncharacterized protein ndufv3 isoform X2 [Pseudorasbora parva]|uniref:uncharacterized protein ndufv3 isoform X2 n=1 Tax=Pseudorasbora parva TaxID=51549 RepID=UPI00351E1A2F
MATSLLRLGRLGSVKCLLRDSWSTPRTSFVAALCTKGDVPPKTPKKAKASTIEADERASLLAYKSAVAFPSKLSATGFLLKDIALGETETAEVVSTATANETTTDGPVVETSAAEIAVEEAKTTDVPPTDGATSESEGSKTSDVKAEVQKDQENTSSSSSSDSDSDSDSDDEKPKTETPAQSGEKVAEENKAPGLTIEEVGVTDKEAKSESASLGEAQESAEDVTKATPEEVPAPSATPVGSVETLIDPAPVLSSTNEAVPEVEGAKPESASFGEAQESAEDVTKATPEEVPAPSATSVETLIDPAPVLSSTTEAIPEVSSESIIVATPDKIVDTATEIKTAPTEEIAVEKEPEFKVEEGPVIKVEDAVQVSAEAVPEVTTEARPEEVAETAVDASSEVSPEAAPKAEAGTLAAPSEELEDPAPVTADAVEALAETEIVETPEEQAPEKAPEPETFDNTTYKNLQHHQYNEYTFADMDVEMSKHRLPQPSARRH